MGHPRIVVVLTTELLWNPTLQKARMGHPRRGIRKAIVESHLCQQKAEMGHPRIVAVLTSGPHKSKTARWLASRSKGSRHSNKDVRTYFQPDLMLNFA